MSSNASGSGSHSPEDIRKQLYRKIKLRNDLQRSFLPKEAIESVLTESTIDLLLQRIPDAKGISLGDITGDRKRVKLLSILLLAEKVDRLKHLIEKGIFDVDLPVELDRLRRADCSGRKRAIVDPFFLLQFRVCVPVLDFSKDTIEEEKLHKDHLLPFSTKKELGKGGQGRVWKVKIPRGNFTTRTSSVSCMSLIILLYVRETEYTCLSEHVGSIQPWLWFCVERIPQQGRFRKGA